LEIHLPLSRFIDEDRRSSFALRNRVLLAKTQQGPTWIPENDPFYDTSIAFDLGATDERTHDRTLYGRR
jgi:hypothetical protein